MSSFYQESRSSALFTVRRRCNKWSLAFERSKSENPTIGLYCVDGKHPSLEGTYLAACVFYAALYGKSPEGNGYVAGLNANTAGKLQKTAWDSVTAFYGKAPDGSVRVIAQ